MFSKVNMIMVKSTKEISLNITMNSEPLEEVTSFKYLRAVMSKDSMWKRCSSTCELAVLSKDSMWKRCSSAVMTKQVQRQSPYVCV